MLLVGSHRDGVPGVAGVVRTLEAAIIGWLAGAAVLVAMGAPSRRPTTEAVVDGLAAVGLALRQPEPASVDARGSTPYFGVGEDGDQLFVKALGDDERSADVLFRLYRRLRPRDFGDEKPFGSLRRARSSTRRSSRSPPGTWGSERRGSERSRRPTQRVRPRLRGDRRQVARPPRPGEITDDVLGRVLASGRASCGEHRIAHRDLRLANIFLDDDGEVWLIDFGFSEMAASDLLLATDVAELIASSSMSVGAERAVAHAVSTVDPETLARALDRLRPWALSGATRTALKSRSGLLDELRTPRVAAAAGGRA